MMKDYTQVAAELSSYVVSQSFVHVSIATKDDFNNVLTRVQLYCAGNL